MNERKELLHLGLFTALLFGAHLMLSVFFDKVFLKFILYSYALIFGLSILEIISLRVRFTAYSGLIPYVILGMSVIKMLMSILWIFYAISRGFIGTDSVIIHFFIPYFLLLAFTAWLMIRIMR